MNNGSNGCDDFASLEKFLDADVDFSFEAFCEEIVRFGDPPEFPTEMPSPKAAGSGTTGAPAFSFGETKSVCEPVAEPRQRGDSGKGFSSASSNQTDTATSTGSRPKLVIPASDFVFQSLGPAAAEPQRGFPSVPSCGGETITTGLSSPRKNSGFSTTLETPFPFSIHRPAPATGPPCPPAPIERVWSEPHSEAGEKTTVNVAVGKRRVEDVDWTKIEDPEERKRQRRMAKNRHTAAVSRERRKNHMRDLETRVERLEQENASLKYWLGIAQRENVSLKGGPVSFVSSAGMGLSSDQDVQPTPVTSGGTSEPAEFLAKLQLVLFPLITCVVAVLVSLAASISMEFDAFKGSPGVGGKFLEVGDVSRIPVPSSRKGEASKWELGSTMWAFRILREGVGVGVG
ncbi:hypothetical protein BSKO_13810 [Bryopsis sp. KO-2023]|nr:hypothetical protein BSKO_13810 [Bryopsis sp. KO-2023]